jgi:hypothetical protein
VAYEVKDNKTNGVIISKLKQARARYAMEWGSGNAARFSEDGGYAWMAGFLDGCTTVLEVGVGNGSSTLALLEAGFTVIGLDENPACLEAARQLLTENGVSVSTELRGGVDSSGSQYSINYVVPGSPFPAHGCLLLEGDIIDDGSLLDWIESNGGVDAIVCWLMGTYQERAFNSAVAGKGIQNPASYRSAVQEKVCSVADQLLPENGIVHIVDRCLLTATGKGVIPGSQAWLAQCEQAYSKRAAGTGLRVDAVDFRSYREPDQGNAPSIKLTRSLAGEDPDISDKAFVSIKLKRS